MTENDTRIIVTLPTEDKAEFKENVDSMSEKLRRIVKSYNEVEDKYDIEKDLEEMNAIVLRTYKNAIQQNIQLMESQVDKIDEHLEDYEDEDEENEVLVEIDLDIAKKEL